MDYSELKEKIKEIEKIAGGVTHEQLRVKCFEVLLSHLLNSSEGSVDGQIHPESNRSSDEVFHEDSAGNQIPTPPVVVTFMRATRITQQQLGSVLLFMGGDIHYVYEPTTQITAQKVIEWALLMALRNAIVDKKAFEVDPEDLRSMCQEKDCYDRNNFWKTFAKKKNAVLFSDVLKAQGKARRLTEAGKKELGRLIESVAESTVAPK